MKISFTNLLVALPALGAALPTVINAPNSDAEALAEILQIVPKGQYTKSSLEAGANLSTSVSMPTPSVVSPLSLQPSPSSYLDPTILEEMWAQGSGYPCEPTATTAAQQRPQSEEEQSANKLIAGQRARLNDQLIMAYWPTREEETRKTKWKTMSG